MPKQLRIERPKRIYAFIKAYRNEFDVRTMCQVLGVSRSSYYEWLQHPLPNRAREDERLLRLIRASYRASHGVYGAPRVFLDLREAGETCGHFFFKRADQVDVAVRLVDWFNRYLFADPD
jgi:putative transposase